MRIKIDSNDSQTVVVIRPRRDLFALLFLGWWIVLWAVGEVTLIGVMAGGLQALLSGDVPNTISTFRYMWPLLSIGLVAWTILGAGMIVGLIWELVGHEELVGESDLLTLRRRFFAVSSEKVFPAKQVANWQAGSSPDWWTSNLEFWGLAGGKIAFESDGKTVRWGRGITDEDARQIIDALRQTQTV